MRGSTEQHRLGSSLILVSPPVLHLAGSSDSFLLARSKTSEIGITAKGCLGKFISSFDFDFPNLCSGPPEIFCEHSATVHLSVRCFSGVRTHALPHEFRRGCVPSRSPSSSANLITMRNTTSLRDFLRFRRRARRDVRPAYLYSAVGIAFLRGCYRQILRPLLDLPKFANGLCRYSDASVHVDSHLIWQATESYVERSSAFGLISHKGSHNSYCPREVLISIIRAGPSTWMAPTLRFDCLIALSRPGSSHLSCLLGC
jgi:hypothetical protein